MHFLLSVHHTGVGASGSGQELVLARVNAFNDRLLAAGVFLYSGALQAPAGSLLVDATHAQPTVTAGTAISGSTQPAGFWVIDVADQDEAVDWARGASVATGRVVEVRRVDYGIEDEPADEIEPLALDQMPVGATAVSRRVVRAPIEEVWRAWTRAELMRDWFSPTPDSPSHVEVDARPGGHYRALMAGFFVHGTYFQVQQPHALAFSWQWEHEPHVPESTVHVELSPVDEGTLVVITHTGFTTEDDGEGHREGWNLSLHRLGVLLDR
ncbi:SRPBCC domain-containing protein [Luteococcus peritonei]|uniref:SRPBCC domain-containing protein n=1 Tax=Luteococcus peritonei TaxID=88874 RepID=A0ABW4RUG6_9ACTN